MAGRVSSACSVDHSGSPEEAGRRATGLGRRTAEVRPGPVLVREWNGRIHSVAVLRPMALLRHAARPIPGL